MTRVEEIATPVSFSGFTAATLEHFAPQLRELGLDPRQGVSGGGRLPDALGDPKKLEPGSMISVQLLSGDMNVGADGTVTMIDGNKIYAFGHRLAGGRRTELPFARSEVLALLPNLSSSFKISQPREWMGTITEDRNSAISGLTGRRARMTPIEIKVGSNTYRMGMIQDRVMTPLVAQMAVFSAIDATARNIGAASYTVRGQHQFRGRVGEAGQRLQRRCERLDARLGRDRHSAELRAGQRFRCAEAQGHVDRDRRAGSAPPDADRRCGRAAAGAPR